MNKKANFYEFSLEDKIRYITPIIQLLVDAEFTKFNGSPTADSALGQANLLGGDDVVCDYLRHGENGLAYDHLKYMVDETDIIIDHSIQEQIDHIASSLHPTQSKSTNLTMPNSIVEVHNIYFEMTFVNGEQIAIHNPLGTDYDLADLFIGKLSDKLKSSPFLHSWTKKEQKEFIVKKGIWLFANPDQLFLRFGTGNAHKEAPNTDCTMFYVIPDDLLNKTNPIRLTITCSN